MVVGQVSVVHIGFYTGLLITQQLASQRANDTGEKKATEMETVGKTVSFLISEMIYHHFCHILCIGIE